MTQSIVRHPINIIRTPIVDGGLFPQTFKEWMNTEFGAIHTIMINDEPWFMASEIAKILGYVKPRNAVYQNTANEDRMIVDLSTALVEGYGKYSINPSRLFINESGLYTLIFGSKLPSAKRFKRWVTHEVLPSIRKYGAYITPEEIERMKSDPSEVDRLLKQLDEAMNQIKEDAPLVEFAKRFMDSDNLISSTTFAKSLGMTCQKWHKMLKKKRILYRDKSGVYQLYAPFVNRDWLQLSMIQFGEKLIMYNKWTPKGFMELTLLLTKTNKNVSAV